MFKKLIKITFIIILILGIYNSYIYMVNIYKFSQFQDCGIKLLYLNLDLDIKTNICLQKLK